MKDPMLRYTALKGIKELGRKNMTFYTAVLGKATDGSILYARQLPGSTHAMRRDEVSRVLQADEAKWLIECIKSAK